MAKEKIIIEKESKTDIAYRLLSKKDKEIGFYELWEKVKKEFMKANPDYEGNLDEDISFFYTNLTLDGRFVNVGDNKWNLRDRVTFEKVHLDMNEIYAEDEEEPTGDEEETEYVKTPDEFDENFEESSDDDDISHYRSKVSDEDEDEEF